MLSMAELRAAFKPADTPTYTNNNYYPFWNMNIGESATIRFLPDVDTTNPLAFLTEKLMHNLTINGETKRVPCLKMYNEDCPICNVSRAYYKDNDEDMGKRYWRKKQHIAQVLIISDPLPADDETGETHEGKVRYISLGFQLYNVIKEAFESGELDVVPFAHEDGCDFVIKKSRSGKFDSYAVGSKFQRKTRNLTDDEIAVAEENSVELHTLLPTRPDIATIESMLEADLTGEAYIENQHEDDDTDDEDDNVPTKVEKPKKQTKKTPAPKLEETEETEETEDEQDSDDSSDDDSDSKADAILAKIRNRRKTAV